MAISAWAKRIVWTSIVCWNIVPVYIQDSTTARMHHMDADKAYSVKARMERNKNTRGYSKYILEAITNETTAVRPPTPAPHV